MDCVTHPAPYLPRILSPYVQQRVHTLAIRESEILRKIFGPVKENGVGRIRTVQELMDVYREADVVWN
jgi:hypothetical protein